MSMWQDGKLYMHVGARELNEHLGAIVHQGRQVKHGPRCRAQDQCIFYGCSVGEQAGPSSELLPPAHVN